MFDDSTFIDQLRNEGVQKSILGHGCMRRKVLCLSDGSLTMTFTALRKPRNTRMRRIFIPQRKRTMDDLNVALDGLELLEIPLKRLEILQECRLSVWTGHRRHELIRQVR